MLINVFHLTRESTNWDTTAIFCSAIGLIYAISCFVRVLQLTGKIDKKSHSKVIHRLEYAWFDIEATKYDNSNGEADSFLRACKELGFTE